MYLFIILDMLRALFIYYNRKEWRHLCIDCNGSGRKPLFIIMRQNIGLYLFIYLFTVMGKDMELYLLIILRQHKSLYFSLWDSIEASVYVL
jgi:hypothetical protein